MEVHKLLRGIDGFSLAALRTLVLRGPDAARRVIRGTLENSDPSVSRCITARNLARSFPADDNVVIPAGS